MIYSYQGVPVTHFKSTFDSYDWGAGQKGLKEYLLSFVAGKRKGMAFIGKPGVGKTHLMVATYFALQEADVLPGSGVIYFDWQDLLNYLRSGFELSVKADATMVKLCCVPYLIIDDVKPESQGTFWKDILEQIIEYCYNNKTKLLLSTNADTSDELIERWGLQDYHVSRLSEMCDIMVIKGKDHRLE